MSHAFFSVIFKRKCLQILPVWRFYNNFYIIIIYLLLSNLHFIFLSSARTAPEPGHSRLIDPGHNRIKVKYVSPTIIISYNGFDHDCALRCIYKYDFVINMYNVSEHGNE